MPDPDARPRRITAVATAVVVVVLLLGGLYMAGVASRLSYLRGRNFRIAATLAEVAEIKLNNVRSVLDSQAQRGSDGELPSLPCFEHLGWHEAVAGAADSEQQTGEQEQAPAADHAGDHGHTHAPDAPPEIAVEHAGGTISFFVQQPDGDPHQPQELHARVDVDCFFAPLEEHEAFDDLVVLDGEGRSVFQAGGSGARIHELAVERADDGEPPDGEGATGLTWAASISRFEEVELAGERYAFFRQPVRLEFRRRGQGDDRRPVLWEVVALVRSDRLLADAMRLDPSGRVVLVSVLLLAVCAWPLIKLAATGKRERIQTREVAWVSAALAVASALLAVAALNVGYNKGRRADLQDELERGADEIEAALESEIGAALVQLEALEDTWCPRWTQAPGDGVRACAGDGVYAGGVFETGGDGGGPGIDPMDYPYLEMVFWTDRCGNQVAKRAVGKPTPRIPVAGREYFQRVRDRELWSPSRWYDPIAAGSDELRGIFERGFFVEPVRSWTTGEQQVVLSVPYRDGGAESAPTPAAAACSPDGERGPPIAAMSVIELPSMLRPILPPGRGFAALDAEGGVVFHSHAERNGLEDFVQETEHSPELRAALYAGAERHFNAPYGGRSHQMYTRPLAGLPWQLVVFEQRDLLQTVNFEAAMAALMLALVEIGLVAAAIAFIRLLGRRGSIRSLWPAPDDVATYVRMMAISLPVALGFVATLRLAPSTAALVATGFCLPLITLGLSVAAATPPPAGRASRRNAALLVAAAATLALLGREVGELIAGTDRFKAGALLLLHGALLGICFTVTLRELRLPATELRLGPMVRRWLTPTVLFVVASGLTLSVLSGLPAAAFLRATFQERLILEARRGQLQLAHALVERRRRIEREYGALPVDLSRLLLDGRDVHYRGYLDTRFAYAIGGDCRGEEGSGTAAEGCGGWDRDGDCASAGPDPSERFAAWTVFELPFFNQHSVEARATGAEEGRSGWSWASTGPPEPRLVLAGGPPVRNENLAVCSRLPKVDLPPPRHPGFWGFLAAVLASFGALAAVLVFLGRRMFHVDFRLRRPPSLDELEERRLARLLAVVPPGTAIGGAFAEAALAVDLAEAGTDDGDAGLEELKNLPPEGLVSIDHLEGVLDDAPSRATGLGLFEKAMTRAGGRLRIVAVSHRDPRAVLDAEEARLGDDDDAREARKVLARWRELLDRFPERWVPDAGDPAGFAATVEREIAKTAWWRFDARRRLLGVLRRECRWSRPLQEIGLRLLDRPELAALDPEDLAERIGHEAADHYHELWQALAADERHVLAQLAGGCLVNRGLERPLDRLLAWGLVVRDLSTFRVMNESFRRFVVGHHDPKALLEWEAEESVSFWRQVRTPFFTVLTVVGVFLLVTQRDLFNLTVAFASAGAVALPALLNLFGWFRRTRKGGEGG